jgi:hypothetical protein
MTNTYQFFFVADGMCQPRPSPPHLHFEFPLLSPALLQIPIHEPRRRVRQRRLHETNFFLCLYHFWPSTRRFSVGEWSPHPNWNLLHIAQRGNAYIFCDTRLTFLCLLVHIIWKYRTARRLRLVTGGEFCLFSFFFALTSCTCVYWLSSLVFGRWYVSSFDMSSSLSFLKEFPIFSCTFADIYSRSSCTRF